MHSRVSTVQKKRWADPDYRARMLRTLEKARAKNLARYRTQPRIRYSTSKLRKENLSYEDKTDNDFDYRISARAQRWAVSRLLY